MKKDRVEKDKIYKLTVRLNPKDYEKLLEYSKGLEITKSQAIRELLGKTLYLDTKEFNENLRELLIIKRSISNSLNQISKKFNSSTVEKFKIIEKEMEELWQSLNQ